MFSSPPAGGPICPFNCAGPPTCHGQPAGTAAQAPITGERLLEETFETGKIITATQYSGNHGKEYQSSLLRKRLFEYDHLELAEQSGADEHFYGPDAIDYVPGRDPFQPADPTLTPSFPGGRSKLSAFYGRAPPFTGRGPVPSVIRKAKQGSKCIVDETGQLNYFAMRQGVTRTRITKPCRC